VKSFSAVQYQTRTMPSPLERERWMSQLTSLALMSMSEHER
jgi:hypothetical protein